MRAERWQDPPQQHGGGMQLAMPSLTRVVKWLILANVGVFLATEFLLAPAGAKGTALGLLAIVPTRWIDAFPFVPVWQLFSYGFLHGDPFHILYNMLFLYFLGTMLEETVGPRRFLVFYVVSVILAGFAQLVVGLLAGSGSPVIGASGGVLAVVCAVATLRPTMRVIFILFPMTLKTLALIIVGIDVLRVLYQLQGQASEVASFAHLGGAALGYLAVRRGWIWHDPIADLERLRERHARERTVEDRKRLDLLLDRIHREGIGSLTPRERAFLKRVSKDR